MRGEIEDGFRLLTKEVLQAAHEARDLLAVRDPAKSLALGHRVSYITTQVALLQKLAMDMTVRKPAGHRESLRLQGVSSVASRLERISDMLLNLDRQASYLSSLDVLAPYQLKDFFQDIFHGLDKIHPALQKRDVGLAVALGQVEERLDALYAQRFARLIADFRTEAAPEDLVTAIMIVHYLERIGDMILEIGEKIIYIIMGEKIKLEQYKALGEGLRAAGAPMEPARLDFRSIWGGRSGCRIGVVGNLDGGGPADQTVLFKHGPVTKLASERGNLALWSELRPGLTPQVRAFIPAQAGAEAALMMEFIPSRTLQALFLENAPEAAVEGLRLAFEIMCGVWRETRSANGAPSDFCRQAETRLPEAAVLYPRLLNGSGALGDWSLKPAAVMLEAAKLQERNLTPPFKMRVHGDWNLSNLLYDPTRKRVTFVDLYRSRETDYVQDISVMLLSIIRLPVLEAPPRRRLTQAAKGTAALARLFAQELDDAEYEARLAFGLARSFVTSTRFVLEERLAEQFVARARYLWGRLIEHGQAGRPWPEFTFSLDVLDVAVE
ncbi:MAG: phosphotransferase [Deltaproteobacteria bacterium]|jgi:phosphate uptake regulator|nr:phosphotransferase [Deltaproteobacteria bacterium]